MPASLRPQGSNPGLKAPKACVLPLHQGGPRARGQRDGILSQAQAPPPAQAA